MSTNNNKPFIIDLYIFPQEFLLLVVRIPTGGILLVDASTHFCNCSCSCFVDNSCPFLPNTGTEKN